MGLRSFVRDRKQVTASRATTSGKPQSFAQWNSEFNNNGQPAKGPSILDTYQPSTSKPLAQAPKEDIENPAVTRLKNANKDGTFGGVGIGAHWTDTNPGYDLMH